MDEWMEVIWKQIPNISKKGHIQDRQCPGLDLNKEIYRTQVRIVAA
jgi:hypothetical protein